MKNQVNFYIPVEIKSRELYPKILLAKYAAKKGFNVILGRKSEINNIVTKMKPGIYYGLAAVKNFAPFYKILSERGHFIVINDEEGLVTYSEEMYLSMKVSRATIKIIDLFFSWGNENNKVILSGHPEAMTKLSITGNPRYDLLKPQFRSVYEKEIYDIRQKYKKFVLVCTSFASCNHYNCGTNYVQELIDKQVLTSDEVVESYKRYQKIKYTTLQSFLKAIPMLASVYPDTDIVVRPHPSENPTPYVELSQKFRNVHVEDKFSVHPWILSSKALVHHYCTTSIEAYSAKIPGFALRPEKDPTIETELPYDCSYECKTPDELISSIRGCVDESVKKVMPINTKKDYSDYVHNIDDIVASELIVNKICKKLKTKKFKKNTNYKIYNDKNEFYYFIRSVIEKIIPWNRGARNYISHKFDQLTVAEVKNVLGAYTGEDLGDFKCERLGNNIVNISYARNK